MPFAPWSWGFYVALCVLVLPGESWAPRSADTVLQAHRRDKVQPETARPTNTRNNQMVKGKHKNPTNKNQGHMATSELSSPNTPEKQEMDLKLYLMLLIEGFKKDLNNSFKEIQNMGLALKEETQKSLREIQEIMG